MFGVIRVQAFFQKKLDHFCRIGDIVKLAGNHQGVLAFRVPRLNIRAVIEQHFRVLQTAQVRACQKRGITSVIIIFFDSRVDIRAVLQ
ncbi:MAG: hypothetical protein PHE10_08155 [Kiritimatiellae bacterium]|nr:hypothetical protein [Kiritimatiellia bacterium]